MQKQVDTIEQDIKVIKEALLGSEFNKDGLISRVEKIEKYQATDRKHKFLIAGGAATLGFLLNLIK